MNIDFHANTMGYFCVYEKTARKPALQVLFPFSLI